jgi:hypothetical protein
MRVDLSEQKIPVDLSSREKGCPFEQRTPVDLSSRGEAGPSGPKNSGGPVIT